MTRPTEFGPPRPDGWAGVGGDPSLPDGQIDEDCCADAEEQPDRALGLSVFIGVEGGDGSLVQWDSATDGGGGSSLAYPGDTTLGNLLVCVISVRGASPGTPTTPTDWALVENGGQFDANNLTMFWRLAPGGPVSVAFPSPTNEVRLVVMEFQGASEGILGTPTSVIAGGSGTTFTIPSVTVAAAAVLVGAVDGGNFPLGLDFTEDAAFTNIDEGQVHGGLDPRSIVGYRVVAAGTYGYAPTGSSASTYGGVLAAFGADGAWVGAGPNITDGDDTTCQEVVGPNVARLWLGAPFAIARIRLYMEIETAGARTYILKGANEADFSDAVTVATLNFTATGSFTGQEVADSWTATDSYEFWELTGDDETRNLCSFELYEGSTSGGVTVHEDLTGRDDPNQHPADAVSVTDAGGYFTGTDVEAALQELGASAGGGSGIYINVKDAPYSAAGDGTTDDTSAIQDAIDALVGGGGGTIFFPTGTYKVTTTLNVHYGSDTEESITFLGEGSAVYPSSRIHMATANTTCIDVTHVYYFGLSSMWVTGQNIDNAHAQTSGSGVKTVRNITMDNSQVSGFFYGVRIGSSAWNSAIRRSAFFYNTDSGIWQEAGSNALSVHNVHALGNGTGIRIDGCEATNVLDCIVEKNNTYAIRWNGGSSNTQGGTIQGCYFENTSGKTEILIGDSSRVDGLTLVGNTFIKASHASTSGWSIDAPYATGLTIIGGYTDSTEAVRVNGSSTAIVMTRMVRTNSGTVTIPSGSIVIDPADTTTPSAIGTAAHGSSPYTAPINHVHATGAGTPSTQALGDSATTGTGPAAAMTDHKHAMPALSSATPLVESGAGAVGTALPSSREDHVHPAASSGSTAGAGDHEHIQRITFSGDAATTVWELPAAPVDAYSVDVFVSGVWTEVTLSGAMLTTMTFGSAPASATDNIKVNIIAATA